MTATGFTSAPPLEPMKSAPSPASSQVRPTKCSWPAMVSSAIAWSLGLRVLEGRAAPLRQGQPRLLRAVEHGRGVIAGGEPGKPGLLRITQRLPGHRQRGGGVLRLIVGEQGAVELEAQLAGILVAHGVPHGDHRRDAALEQRVGGARVAGLFVQRDVLRGRVRRLLRARLLALGHGEEVLPVLHAEDVAGVAGAEEEEPRDEAATQVQEFLAGEAIAAASSLGEFQEIEMPVPAPVDDVVTAILPDLRLQPLAGDAVGEEVGHDAALRVDLLLKQPQQLPPLPPRRQRTRAPRLGEDEEHAQGLVRPESKRLRGRCRHVVDDADEEVPISQRGLVYRRPRDLPRHARQRCRQLVLLLRRAGQLDAERALVVGLPELEEDLLAQHFLRDAHADLRDAGRLLPLLHVVLQVIPQVEQPLSARYGDGLEIRRPVEELITIPIEQAEFRREARRVRGDDEVEVR